jgi:hypothetical protein
MQIQTKIKKKTWKDWQREYSGLGGTDVPILELRPNDDAALHIIEYKGKKITVSRRKGKKIKEIFSLRNMI